jgi:hypothetical protein
MRRWLEAASEACEALATALGPLHGAKVAERRPFVQGFVAAARATKDQEVREAALKSASQLARESLTLANLLPTDLRRAAPPSRTAGLRQNELGLRNPRLERRSDGVAHGL